MPHLVREAESLNGLRGFAAADDRHSIGFRQGFRKRTGSLAVCLILILSERAIPDNGPRPCDFLPIAANGLWTDVDTDPAVGDVAFNNPGGLRILELFDDEMID